MSSNVVWRKSSRCNADGCVEVAEVGDKVAFGKDGSARVLYTREELALFRDGFLAGEFDDLCVPVVA